MIAPLLLLFQIAGELPVAPLPMPSVKRAEAAEPAAAPAPPPTLDEARRAQCLEQSRTDPAGAIAAGTQWAGEAVGDTAAYAHQCLGQAHTALLEWDAAERAFLTARETLGEDRREWRARLALQAGNAALAGNRADAALFDFALADADLADGDPGLGAMIAIDRARALVASGKEGEAAPVLERARTLDPQSPYAWLLSSTLARRIGNLAQAQGFIETAARLAPDYPEIGLEAGVIAMLAGDAKAARASWQSVIDLAPGEDAAVSARAYLAQLDELGQ